MNADRIRRVRMVAAVAASVLMSLAGSAFAQAGQAQPAQARPQSASAVRTVVTGRPVHHCTSSVVTGPNPLR